MKIHALNTLSSLHHAAKMPIYCADASKIVKQFRKDLLSELGINAKEVSDNSTSLTVDIGTLEECLRESLSKSHPKPVVITLDIGGEKTIKIRRQALTLEMTVPLHGSIRTCKSFFLPGDVDQEGTLFVDQSPKIFMPLIEYLRMKQISPTALAPSPHNFGGDLAHFDSFLSMLEHYSVKNTIFPLTLVPQRAMDPRKSLYIAKGSLFTLSNNNTEYYIDSTDPKRHVKSFSIEMIKGSLNDFICVGWATVVPETSTCLRRTNGSVSMTFSACDVKETQHFVVKHERESATLVPCASKNTFSSPGSKDHVAILHGVGSFRFLEIEFDD